jgi:hypothetical protein
MRPRQWCNVFAAGGRLDDHPPAAIAGRRGGLEQGKPMRWVVLLYVVSIVYSVVRYVAFAPHNAGNIPVFIVNKGLSMAAALCFTAAFVAQWRAMRGGLPRVEPTTWFRGGVCGVVAHVPMSLAILRPGYFKEFFAGERLSFNGEMVFLLGALAATGIYLLTRTTWSASQRWRLSLVTMAVLFGHVLAMGIARGLNINRSHAYLPPMWLLSVIGIALGIAFLAMSRPRERSEPGAGT